MQSSNGLGYTLTRTLPATADSVWQAWTTPDQYATWANAVPGTVELDVRPGGAWKATMETPAGQFPLTGSYLEVVAGKRLVIGMDVPGRPEPAAMRVELEDQGADQTTIVVSQTCDSEQQRDISEQGTTMLLDGLTAYLTKP